MKKITSINQVKRKQLLVIILLIGLFQVGNLSFQLFNSSIENVNAGDQNFNTLESNETKPVLLLDIAVVTLHFVQQIKLTNNILTNVN